MVGTLSGEVGDRREAGVKPLGGEYGPVVSFASTRKVTFDGLTAGLTYVFQLMAIGGSTGQSDWSEPSRGMAQ